MQEGGCFGVLSVAESELLVLLWESAVLTHYSIGKGTQTL